MQRPCAAGLRQGPRAGTQLWPRICRNQQGLAAVYIARILLLSYSAKIRQPITSGRQMGRRVTLVSRTHMARPRSMSRRDDRVFIIEAHYDVQLNYWYGPVGCSASPCW